MRESDEIKQEILETLADPAAYTAGELARRMNFSVEYVRAQIVHLIKAGRLEQLPNPDGAPHYHPKYYRLKRNGNG